MTIQKLYTLDEIKSAYNSVNASFPDFENEVDIDAYLNKLYKFAGVYTVFDNGKAVAFCAVYMNDADTKKAYITLIGVSPDYKGNGIGTRLFRYIENEAAKAGMTSLHLEVKKDNINAIEFYKKQSMTVEDESKTSFYMKKEL